MYWKLGAFGKVEGWVWTFGVAFGSGSYELCQEDASGLPPERITT